MSIDNYLLVDAKGYVWEGSASSPEPADAYGSHLYFADGNIALALAWAHRYCQYNIVEHGVTLSAGAQIVLEADVGLPT